MFSFQLFRLSFEERSTVPCSCADVVAFNTVQSFQTVLKTFNIFISLGKSSINFKHIKNSRNLVSDFISIMGFGLDCVLSTVVAKICRGFYWVFNSGCLWCGGK